MKTTAGRLSVITAYFLIYVVWGSTYYFISVALEGLPTFLLGALRFSAAGLLLLSFCGICRGESVFRAQLIRRSAVSGIVLLFVDMAVIMLAQRYVSSSLVAIVASSTAIWIMLLDAPMWRTNFRSRTPCAASFWDLSGWDCSMPNRWIPTVVPIHTANTAYSSSSVDASPGHWARFMPNTARQPPRM